MDDYWKLVEDIIPVTYARQASDAFRTRENIIKKLLQRRKLPDDGWDNSTIELLLNRLALMDSNNFPSNCGLGEREARFASSLVAQRHYNLGHGLGRSGDLNESQPKAAGSTLLYRITNSMIADLIRLMGIQAMVDCFVVPLATGMSLVLVMLTLKNLRTKAKYVIWPRIDQKSCFKSILTAGLIPIIIEPIKKGDQLETNLEEIEKKIKDLTPESIVCIMSTTSCFAPRACDNIEAIAKICKYNNIPHLINNAYGMQSKYIMKRIQKAERVGRVDAFVQSTDKNLMVPVGGAIIASFDVTLLHLISKNYPGRASAAPIIDAFITLLSLGRNGYLKLVQQREIYYKVLKEKLITLMASCGERVLETPDNPISLAVTLINIPNKDLTSLGSKLFIRNVSGTRVLTTKDTKLISDYRFFGWGSHINNFEIPYLTAAASIGIELDDINMFLKRLEKLFVKSSVTPELEIKEEVFERVLDLSQQSCSE